MSGYRIFASPIGEILVAGTQHAVTHILHGSNAEGLAAEFLQKHSDAFLDDRNAFLDQSCRAISNYLRGISRRIAVAVEPIGTDFQRKVWQELCRISYGKTVSYSEVAARIGMPKAFRAVANACGDNPVPLIVPCHRVIHKNGNVSGFAWGKQVKLYLLELEKARPLHVAA